MKLTIQDVLDITPLKHAKILAGARSLNREVRNVNIVEVPDTVRWMRGCEIMFSSGFAFSGDADKGISLLSSLNSHNISALVLKPGVYMSCVPESMIAYAEKIGFPLLEIPADMPYSVYIEAIYALLLNNQSYLLGLNHTGYAMPENGAVIENEEKNICRILAARIHRTVYYLTTDGEIISTFSEHPEPEKERAEKLPKDFSELERMYILVPVYIELEPRAYLAVQRSAEQPSPTDTAMMEYSAQLLSVELRKEQLFAAQKQKYRRALLDDLIAGVCGSRETVLRRCELLQFRLNDPYLAFAVSFEDANGETDAVELAQNYVTQIMEHGAIQYNYSCLLTVRENQVVGVCSFPSQATAQVLARQILEEMLAAVNVTYQSLRTTAGISSWHTGFEQIGIAVTEAQKAVSINRRFMSQKTLTSLEELGIYRVLCELRDSPAMKEFCQSMLQPIWASDNCEDLLQTIESYYDHGCNLRRTAEALFLHTNSVKYRLARVNQLLEKNITDPDVQLNLWLCLKYRKML